MTGRCVGDRGAAGGLEMMAFGLLVFVVGTLLIANAWAAVDLRLALGAAARDAARAYVEAPDAAGARWAADDAARTSLEAQGRSPARTETAVTTDGFGRCARVEVTLTQPLRAVHLPWIRGLTEGLSVRATHSELVDPYRSGLPGAAACDP